MFCSNCGKEIIEGQKFCSGCGKNLDPTAMPTSNTAYQQFSYQYNNPTNQNEDSGSLGWGLLGFFVPLAGLILFLMWDKTKPNNAKSAGIGAIIGVICPIVIVILIYIIVAIASAAV